jgi:hypothetical protein
LGQSVKEKNEVFLVGIVYAPIYREMIGESGRISRVHLASATKTDASLRKKRSFGVRRHVAALLLRDMSRAVGLFLRAVRVWQKPRDMSRNSKAAARCTRIFMKKFSS